MPSGSCSTTQNSPRCPATRTWVAPSATARTASARTCAGRSSAAPSGADVDVEVHAVLGHLGLRDPLEEQPRASPGRVDDGVGAVPLVVWYAERHQRLLPRAEALRRRLLDITEQLGPERPQPGRVTGVEGHLHSHRHDGQSSSRRGRSGTARPACVLRPACCFGRPACSGQNACPPRQRVRVAAGAPPRPVSWSQRSSDAAPSSGRRARRAVVRPARSAGLQRPGASGW